MKIHDNSYMYFKLLYMYLNVISDICIKVQTTNTLLLQIINPVMTSGFFFYFVYAVGYILERVSKCGIIIMFSPPFRGDF